METVGLRDERIVLKADQETSAADIVREVAKLRSCEYGAALEQSAVGESNTNATIERAIQDVESQARTLRAALEKRIEHKIVLSDTVVPWLIRHAAALITRCRVRANGHTALEMMRGRKTHAELTEFGETVMFKIPKTKFNPGKFEDQWDMGIYLGYDMRSMESLIGTGVGVFKVSDIRRKPNHERWSSGRVRGMEGSPKAPVPGQSYRRTPAFSKKFGRTTRPRRSSCSSNLRRH